MKRQLPERLIKQAKKDLKERVIARIIRNANSNNCWHLNSIYGDKMVDAVCHFRDSGKKKIFFKARRLVFELIKGDIKVGLSVYSNCENKYCVNPDHQYISTAGDYIKKMEELGIYKRRLGFKHSDETIAKMSRSQRGKKPGKKTRLKMRLAKLGKKRDPEIVPKTAEKYFRGLQNKISSYKLARKYPVTASHIRSIWRRACWKHLL